MGHGSGSGLLLVAQIFLLVLNYVYKWNLPWYYLWLPLVTSIILLVIGVVILIIGFLISTRFV